MRATVLLLAVATSGHSYIPEYPNGVNGAMVPDATGQITELSYTNGGPSPIARRLINRHPGGMKQNEIYLNGLQPLFTAEVSQTRTHDGADRLNSVTDDIGAGANAFTHDANGNLTSGGGRTISHDFENRITSHNTAVAQLAFTYDGVGHRTSRTENGTTEHHVLDQGAALRIVRVRHKVFSFLGFAGISR